MIREPSVATAAEPRTSTLTARDGTRIYYKDQINADLLGLHQRIARLGIGRLS